MISKHIGSNFDALLAEEGMLEEASAAAMKRVNSWKSAKRRRVVPLRAVNPRRRVVRKRQSLLR